MKTAVILQPNYLPWSGIFDLIRRCDVFIAFDIVQYTKSDWRNRNKIDGTRAATVNHFVSHSLSDVAPIDTVTIADRNRSVRHLWSIQKRYARAPSS